MRLASPIGAAFLLLCSAAGARAEEHTSRTTRIVKERDGTRTTTVTEVRTVNRGGRVTTTRRTVSRHRTTRLLPPRRLGAVGLALGFGEERLDPAPDGAEPAVLAGPALAAAALAAHNRERARADRPQLGWSPDLSKLAGAWARHLCPSGAALRSLAHRPSGPEGPGENLWQGAGTDARPFSVDEAVKAWAAERRFFDARSGRCRGGVCGHYTQLIWGRTTQVGCGAATCRGDGLSATVWVCNYAPAGNVIGERP